MKSFFLTNYFLLLIHFVSFGQVGVRVFNYRPLGKLGFHMKPLTSLELSYQDDLSEDDRFRASFGISYLNMKPRLASFPVYSVDAHGGNGNEIFEGAQIFNKYTLLQFSSGVDYAFLCKGKLIMYVGNDIIGGSSEIDYKTTYFGSSGGKIVVENLFFIGYRVKLGIEYNMTDNIGFFVNASRLGFVTVDPPSRAGAIDIGFGMRYLFFR